MINCNPLVFNGLHLLRLKSCRACSIKPLLRLNSYVLSCLIKLRHPCGRVPYTPNPAGQVLYVERQSQFTVRAYQDSLCSLTPHSHFNRKPFYHLQHNTTCVISLHDEQPIQEVPLASRNAADPVSRRF